MSTITDEILGPWLALFHWPHLSLKRKHQLLSYWSSPKALVSAGINELRDAGVDSRALAAIQRYQASTGQGKIAEAMSASLAWASKPNRHIIHYQHPDYPSRLKETSTPPLLLFVEGGSGLLKCPQLALVGSRNATSLGQETAYLFAEQLAAAGIIVTSGLAMGIDAAGHRGALAAGGNSIAVMATGADRIYPARHRSLAHEIVTQGALVTEFPLCTEPRPPLFPQRNRIISGMSVGVLVVEAAVKSGSLITANYAALQGREVFAVPGSIHNPQSRGCNALIRQGAKLVETLEDILEELQPILSDSDSLPGATYASADCAEHGFKQILEQSCDAASIIDTTVVADMADANPATDVSQMPSSLRSVIDVLDDQAVSMDVLVGRTGLSAATLNPILMQLELKGYVVSDRGGYRRKLLASDICR